MSEKIIISSDSTTDLSPELIERYNIKISPLSVVMDDKAYIDGVEASPEDIYDYYARTGKLAKTAATSIGDHIDFFNSLTADGATVIHFTISASMSVNNHNAVLAAEEINEDGQKVYIVDTKNLSTGGGLLLLCAGEMIKSGMSAAEIVSEIEKIIPCVDASFVIDDLEFLHKGGRCSAVAALGANLLKLKPCITVKNGSMGVEKKYRGKFADVLKTYVSERLADGDDICLDRVFVTHAGCDEEIVNAVLKQVKETLPWKEVFLTRAGCTVSAHCGRNTLGVLFIRKTPIA